MEMKPCPECHSPMPANHVRRVTCSMRCRSWRASRLLKGKPVAPQAHAAAARRQRVRVETATRGEFGDMTRREVAIFNRGAKYGYSQAYYQARRDRRAA